MVSLKLVLAIGGITIGVIAVVLILALWCWKAQRDRRTNRAIKAAVARKPPHVPFWLDIARCELHDDHTITTPDYWRCGCEHPTYWPRDLHTCPRCGAHSDECADADLLPLVMKYGSAI